MTLQQDGQRWSLDGRGEMIPIVSFVGKSNTGKTTFLEMVVRDLKTKGYRVACIKHTHHDFDIDQPGKDTWRLAQAGSDVVAISSPNKLAIIRRPESEPTLAHLAMLFWGEVDIVLGEGYKSENNPKILVVNTEPDREQFYNEENLLGTVFVFPSSAGKPQFAEADVDRIVDLLISQIEKQALHESGFREMAVRGSSSSIS